MDIKELVGNGFRFKKNLGQNFIGDVNLLKAIVNDAGADEDDTVLEIGAGAGTLTRALAERVKKVVAFEVDEELSDALKKVTEEYPNAEVHFADVLKLKDAEIREWVTEPFKVIANLPYYVTTPMIMRFAESELNVSSMTLMMQKEVADRLTAKEDTENYGAITVALRAIADVEIKRTIDRKMFYPRPNVDSALVKIDFRRDKYGFSDYKLFKRTVKAAFAMRRKTLANNLVSAFGIKKTDAEKLIEKSGFPTNIRGESLSCEDIILLSDNLSKFIRN